MSRCVLGKSLEPISHRESLTKLKILKGTGFSPSVKDRKISAASAAEGWGIPPGRLNQAFHRCTSEQRCFARLFIQGISQSWETGGA
jgi:hypothetical protein